MTTASSTQYMPVDKQEPHTAYTPPSFHPHMPSLPHSSSSDYMDPNKQYYAPHSLNPPMQPAPSRPRQIPVMSRLIDLFKAVLLPIVALGYLAFCYTVHQRIVPLNSNGIVDLDRFSLTSVKSGVTSLSILVITIGLYPLKALIMDLRSEEFFRVLRTRPQGVRFATLNSISTPSFGTIDALLAILKRHCSSYFMVSFISGFVVLAVSTLAPSALTVEMMLIDGDIVAFPVGAVTANTVINTTDFDALVWTQSTSLVSNLTQLASSVAWAEHSLDAHYKLKLPTKDGKAYIVPTTADMSASTSARWITDVLVVEPKCTWEKTNITTTPQLNNSVSAFSGTVALLPNIGAEIVVPWSSVGIFDWGILPIDPFDVKNASTHDPTAEGLIAWAIARPVNGSVSVLNDIDINMSSISEAVFTIDVDGDEYDLAFLVCSPNPSIETHVVRADGEGNLVVEDIQIDTRQRNLHPHQMGWLLSFSLSKIHDSAGPQVVLSGLGSKLELELLFGKTQADAFNPQADFLFVPSKAEDITKLYTSFVQSAMKPFTDGALGTANVPGRVARPTAVFASSLPVIIASTALFALLSAVVLISHFRQGKEEYFTLYSVGAVLDQSGLPARFAELKADGVDEIKPRLGRSAQDQMAAQMGERFVSVKGTYHGAPVLQIQ